MIESRLMDANVDTPFFKKDDPSAVKILLLKNLAPLDEEPYYGQQLDEMVKSMIDDSSSHNSSNIDKVTPAQEGKFDFQTISEN